MSQSELIAAPMSNDETVTIRVWRGRHRDFDRDPDETHEISCLDGDRWSAETVQIDGTNSCGWLAFDLVDLPEGMETATLFVHENNSGHEHPLNTRAVERGLVFDGRPYKPGIDPPCFLLDGEVVAHVARGTL